MADAPAGPLPVLVVSTTLAVGGAQRFVSTLLGHLDRERVRPSLCLLRRQIGYALPADVPVTGLGYRRPWHGPAAVRALASHLEEHRPAVVLSNIAASNIITGMALGRLGERRPGWIARVGASPQHDDGPLRALLARRAYPRADRFVVNSTGLVEGLRTFYPFTAGRIQVLPTPTDFALLERRAAEAPAERRPSEGPLLIAVGRLFTQKRYDLMVQALARIRERIPAALWICGDGPLRNAIVERARRLGLGSAVRLLGFRENPFSLLRQADLFVMSSDYEGLPNALIEAQGLGLPAVSTRCPHGPEDIIDSGETGLLVPPGDPRALADAILELLGDGRRLERMGRAAAARARERFSAPALTRQWEDLLLGVAPQPGQSA